LVFGKKYYIAATIVGVLLMGSVVFSSQANAAPSRDFSKIKLPDVTAQWNGVDVPCGTLFEQGSVTIHLHHDVICTGDPEFAIAIVGATNVVLDCDHHKIVGPGGFGVILYQSSGVTVRECDISGFDLGIVDVYGFLNNIKNNKVHDNGDGISLVGGTSFDKVQNNQAKNNLDDGFFVDTTSHDNLLKNNKSKQNVLDGFEDQSSGSGTSGTANTYKNNNCSNNGNLGSDPAGLCH